MGGECDMTRQGGRRLSILLITHYRLTILLFCAILAIVNAQTGRDSWDTDLNRRVWAPRWGPDCSAHDQRRSRCVRPTIPKPVSALRCDGGDAPWGSLRKTRPVCCACRA